MLALPHIALVPEHLPALVDGVDAPADEGSLTLRASIEASGRAVLWSNGEAEVVASAAVLLEALARFGAWLRRRDGEPLRRSGCPVLSVAAVFDLRPTAPAGAVPRALDVLAGLPALALLPSSPERDGADGPSDAQATRQEGEDALQLFPLVQPIVLLDPAGDGAARRAAERALDDLSRRLRGALGDLPAVSLRPLLVVGSVDEAVRPLAPGEQEAIVRDLLGVWARAAAGGRERPEGDAAATALLGMDDDLTAAYAAPAALAVSLGTHPFDAEAREAVVLDLRIRRLLSPLVSSRRPMEGAAWTPLRLAPFASTRGGATSAALAGALPALPRIAPRLLAASSPTPPLASSPSATAAQAAPGRAPATTLALLGPPSETLPPLRARIEAVIRRLVELPSRLEASLARLKAESRDAARRWTEKEVARLEGALDACLVEPTPEGPLLRTGGIPRAATQVRELEGEVRRRVRSGQLAAPRWPAALSSLGSFVAEQVDAARQGLQGVERLLPRARRTFVRWSFILPVLSLIASEAARRASGGALWAGGAAPGERLLIQGAAAVLLSALGLCALAARWKGRVRAQLRETVAPLEAARKQVAEVLRLIHDDFDLRLERLELASLAQALHRWGAMLRELASCCRPGPGAPAPGPAGEGAEGDGAESDGERAWAARVEAQLDGRLKENPRVPEDLRVALRRWLEGGDLPLLVERLAARLLDGQWDLRDPLAHGDDVARWLQEAGVEALVRRGVRAPLATWPSVQGRRTHHIIAPAAPARSAASRAARGAFLERLREGLARPDLEDSEAGAPSAPSIVAAGRPDAFLCLGLHPLRT